MDMVACANSSWIIVVISIERWFAVCKPFQKLRLFTNYRIGMSILCLFIASVICFSYFPFTVAVMKSKTIEINNVTLIQEYKCDMIEEYTKHYKYLGFVSIVLIYFVPFIILAILNAMILHRLHVSPFNRQNKHAKTVHKRDLTKSDMKRDDTMESSFIIANPQANLPVQKVSSLKTNHSKNDRSLSITLLTVSITFMILTFPFQIRLKKLHLFTLFFFNFNYFLVKKF